MGKSYHMIPICAKNSEKIEISVTSPIIASFIPITHLMIDIKILRSNPELVKKALHDKVTK